MYKFDCVIRGFAVFCSRNDFRVKVQKSCPISFDKLMMAVTAVN
jgi:hypothetical protein